MGFPEIERAVYARNPLEAVKCEIRFPPILAIDVGSPVAFQELVRQDFPFYEETTSIKLPTELPAGMAQIVQKNLSASGKKSHVFMSADRKLKLSLSKDGVSLESAQYDRWELFCSQLSKALEAATDVYKPAFFTHTCVRFKNSIRREPLELVGSAWSELINPWVLGLLGQPETAAGVEAAQTKSLVRLPDSIGMLECVLALGIHQPTKQPAFIIESHIFNDEQKAASNVISRLNLLHSQAGRFFRWCITDKLHQAMQPQPVG